MKNDSAGTLLCATPWIFFVDWRCHYLSVKQLLVLLCFRHLSFPNLEGHGSPQQ